MHTTATYHYGNRNNGIGVFGFLILLVLIALAVGVALPAPGTRPVGADNIYSPKAWTRERLAGLPFTKHALEDHPERNLGAVEIQKMMVTLTCKPVLVYICSAEQQVIFTCPLTEAASNLLAGLVVGLIGEPTIVTGYPGASNYWNGNVRYKGCTGPYVVP